MNFMSITNAVEMSCFYYVSFLPI